MSIDRKNKLRKNVKNTFEKDFFKLIISAAFWKSMEFVEKRRDIKLATTERRRNYLASEPNYHTERFFIENVLEIDMRKTQILINKPIYLSSSILEMSKIVMYEFWYDYVEPKYSENTKLCYMETDSFIAHVKTDDIYKDIPKHVETRFGTKQD